jgi:hypothetical protein
LPPSGEEALARLGTEDMANAAAALDTSDFEELGVDDGGEALRAAVEDMVLARQARRAAAEGEAGGGARGGAAGSGQIKAAAGEGEGERLGESGLPVRKAGWWRGGGSGGDAGK